jgi:hypothetical protein
MAGNDWRGNPLLGGGIQQPADKFDQNQLLQYLQMPGSGTNGLSADQMQMLNFIQGMSVPPDELRNQQLERLIGPGTAEGDVLQGGNRADFSALRNYGMPVINPQPMPGQVLDPQAIYRALRLRGYTQGL